MRFENDVSETRSPSDYFEVNELRHEGCRTD